MKHLRIYLSIFILGVIACSCSKEYGSYEYAPAINLTKTNIALSETDAATAFNVFIYNNAAKYSDVRIVVEGEPVVETGSEAAVYGTDFTISPAPVVADNKLTWELTQFDNDTVRFLLTPIHNKQSIENHKYQLKIKSVSEGMAMGGQSSLKLAFNNVDQTIEGYELSSSPKSLVFTPSIASGSISEGKALTLTAKNLSKDISVSKTENFKFSLTNNPHESKDILVIPLSSIVNDNVTFYVFFAPKSSSSGSKSGQLLIKSYGVNDAKVALRGTQL